MLPNFVEEAKKNTAVSNQQTEVSIVATIYKKITHVKYKSIYRRVSSGRMLLLPEESLQNLHEQ